MSTQMHDSTLMVKEVAVIRGEVGVFDRRVNQHLADGWCLHGPITHNDSVFTAVVVKYDPRFSDIIDATLDLGVQQMRSMR